MWQALLRPARQLGQAMIDFALPPRCAGCAEVIEELDGFCPDCWSKLDWLGHSGCQCCGCPLDLAGADLCAACLAAPSPLDRMRAAVAYGDVPRTIALKLKYGRKVALARTMARFMAPLCRPAGAAMVVPVPLHR
ncbi:MAG: double zinc ribbon domain-containing protein, partial [Sphingomonadales bacterium]|nr:double zinc ribbon domain-containing protein [Sphingomonadales bacterium]